MTSGQPALSVVIICFTTPAHLRRALDALVEQSRTTSMEIIVPHDDALDDAPALAMAYPDVRYLRAGARVTPAGLRSHGTRASHAPIVAFLEDHCIPTPSWAASVLAAHRERHVAIGGTIDKGFTPGTHRDTLLNWAVYFTDYSRYMPPRAEGPSHGLSDCNVSYKRSALERVAPTWVDECHENLVNGELERSGETLWFAPQMSVLEQRDLTLGGALSDRFRFGRLFGSGRVSGASFVKRAAMAGAALVMAPLLVLRVARNVVERRRYRLQFVVCLPWISLVAFAWLLGESIGYLTGRADRSLTLPG